MTKTVNEIKQIIEESKLRLGKLARSIDKANVNLAKYAVESELLEGRIDTLEDMLQNPERYPHFELKEE